MGRPTDYTIELAATICGRIVSGEALTKICGDDAMPGVSTVYRWIAEREDFRDMYTRAREDQADTLADEVLAIADEDPALSIQERGGESVTVVDGAAVQHQRLRIDARKWVAAKLKPKKYGDKVTQEHTGEGGGSIKHSVDVAFVGSPPGSV